MSARALALLWLVLGVAIWNGFFDLYVSRGAREYLKLHADFQLGRGPEPDMVAVQAQAISSGVVAATIWAALVVGFGWTTVWLARRHGK